jgi:general L-amino acid transport system permease protein
MSAAEQIPLHRNPRVRAIFIQVAAVIALAWALGTIFANTIHNLEERGIKTGFHFMDDVAPFAIPANFFPFWEFTLGESQYWEVFVIGVQNTILISVLGIVTATLLGFIIGVLRLSPNWLIRKYASMYIEIFRNTPLLLQLLFWNFAVFLDIIVAPKQSWNFADAVFLNKAGLYLPLPIFSAFAAGLFVAAIIAAIFFSVMLARWARKRQDETGRPFPVILCALALFAALPALALLVGGVHFDFPALQGFNFKGGMRLPLVGFVLWFGLSLYTAAFIAENVRGGILAVSRGQTEAAGALGLRRGSALRLVIIPQAMRVIIPPTISQFLNLTKNSTLSAASVGFPELFNIWTGIAFNQSNQALIVMGMTMAVFVTLSFLTSALLNWYNKRAQLKER